MDYEDESSSSISIQLRPNYHFLTRTDTIPYVGATLSTTRLSNGDSDTSTDFGVQAGLKTFLSKDFFFQIELEYLMQSIEDIDIKTTAVTLGMGYKF